jgi:hypothetical protein
MNGSAEFSGVFTRGKSRRKLRRHLNLKICSTPILSTAASFSRLVRVVIIVALHRSLLGTSGTRLSRLTRAAAVRVLTALLACLTGALRIVREISRTARLLRPIIVASALFVVCHDYYLVWTYRTG